MKHRRFLPVLAVCITLALTACGSKTEGALSGETSVETSTSVEEAADTTSLGVTLTAEEITPTGLVLVCTQSGGSATGELQTGSPYWLESRVDGQWENTPQKVEEIFWTMEGWLIPKDSDTRWTVDWEYIYGALPAGDYRLGKEIMDFRGPGDYDVYQLYANFTVNG